MRKHQLTLTLCEGAIFIAAALVLSYIKIPVGFIFGGFGGSIDFVMVPLILYAVRRGAGWGVAAGVIFGTMKFFFAGGSAVSWQSMLLDYSLAYGAVGLAGLCRGWKRPLTWGAVIGCLARFGIHYLSGVTIYAQYMPEVFMEMTMTTPALYSLLYNGSYMSANTVLAVVCCALLERPMQKFIQKT
ncbi:MAG: energy-coupled thiamine transporter ThiT [Oscillospiraceae bacterium]|nr:energy-coupled thiamine transporter ThiT [Oscillospiraceae bacterium]